MRPYVLDMAKAKHAESLVRASKLACSIVAISLMEAREYARAGMFLPAWNAVETAADYTSRVHALERGRARAVVERVSGYVLRLEREEAEQREEERASEQHGPLYVEEEWR